MKLSNDVEKYEFEMTKLGQNYSFFLRVIVPHCLISHSAITHTYSSVKYVATLVIF